MAILRTSSRNGRHDSTRRDRNSPRLVLETLENRVLLASHPTQFADFHGMLGNPQETDTFPIRVRPREFVMPHSRVLMKFNVVFANGSNTSAVDVLVRNGTSEVRDIRVVDGSSTMAELSSGRFDLMVNGNGTATGNYEIRASLVGDLDGNFIVDRHDLRQIASDAFATMRGDKTESMDSDINGDGTIDNDDFQLANRNLGVSTSIRPLELTVGVHPKNDPDDDGLVGRDAVFLRGRIGPDVFTRVIGFDGEADRTRSNRQGYFRFGVPLPEVHNRFRVVARDGFLQSGRTDIEVVKDTEGPTFGSLFEVEKTGDSIVVSGTVSDPIAGPDIVRSRLDGGEWITSLVDDAGAFSFSNQIPLDGSADGSHTFSFEADDLLGNRSHAQTSFQLCASGSNCAITEDSGVQQSPSIATNPLDSNELIIAYMDYSLVDTGYAGIGIARSSDGGVTWTHGSIPVPEPFNGGAASPKALYDHQGRAYVSFSAATFEGSETPGLTNPAYGPDRIPAWKSNNGIFVARSDDGGSSWNEPVPVVSHIFDGETEVLLDLNPDMAIDVFPTLPNGQPNENYGNIYSVWSRVYAPGQCLNSVDPPGGIELRFAVSRDGGLTWEVQDETERSKIRVDVLEFDICAGTRPGEGFIDFSKMQVGAEGEIYVSHFGGQNFAMTVSRDGGDSFEHSNFQTGSQIVFGAGFGTIIDRQGLPNNQFRTIEKRAIAADPVRPGVLYAVEPISVAGPLGNVVDPADVFFGRSEDFGQSWETTFTVGEHPDSFECADPERCVPLNDDNNARSTDGSSLDVISGQAFSKITADNDGNLAVIWYDTRRDPNAVKLDVFGAVSSDGGLSFSPNFRISDQSIDMNEGVFTNAVGEEEFYIGDSIGLAMADGQAYSAWTDTRQGNQDIFFSKFSVNPPPAPLNDRFEPNDTPDRNASPTIVGPIIKRLLPNLAVDLGDEDWFLVESSVTGVFTADVLFDDPDDVLADSVQLELRDSTGATLLASSVDLLDNEGTIIGRQLQYNSVANEELLVLVKGIGVDRVDYSLQLASFTADLGARVFATAEGNLGQAERALYLVSAGATGSATFSVTAANDYGGTLQFKLLDPNELVVVASSGVFAAGSTEQINVQAQQDQDFLLSIEATQASMGGYELEFVNRDLFITPGSNTLSFPIPGGPSQASVADVNNDGNLDVAVTSALSNTVSILLGTDDGLLQTPRQFSVGAFKRIPTDVTGRLPTFGRDVAIADFDNDNLPDLLVTNAASADVSLLLGRGDGTLQPHRRFDATPTPFDLDIGDVNGDGLLDAVVIETALNPEIAIAGLINQGNGAFEVQKTSLVSVTGNNGTIRLGDFNEDGLLDVLASGDAGPPEVSILLGNGDGTFTFSEKYETARRAVAVAVADINGDDNLDIATAGFGGDSPFLSILLGNGDGTFQDEIQFSNPNSAAAMQIVDIGSQMDLPDGSTTLGPPDGRPDILLANHGVAGGVATASEPEVVVFPALFDEQGEFVGLGDPQQLAGGEAPQDLDVGDIDRDGTLDLVIVDRENLTVVYGQAPNIQANDTAESARDLGTVVHLVDQVQTIVPGRTDAFYKFTIPTEAVGSADEVIDVSLLFRHIEGPGLGAELRNEQGTLMGSGERFRARVQQGEELQLHVFGLQNGESGYGSFLPVINVLPQVVSLEAQALLPGVAANPGGPTTSIVATLQGDRLDSTLAEDPGNYQVTFHGDDGLLGTPDDQLIPIECGASESQCVVYNPGANIDVSTGLTFPTAVRQTVTLLFEGALPEGSYTVAFSPDIQTDPFSENELNLLSDDQQLMGHPLVSLNGTIQAGSQITAVDLVLEAGAPDISAIKDGNRFLTQLHDDLGALLDEALTDLGDDDSITGLLADQALVRLRASLGDVGQRSTSLIAFLFDPLSPMVEDPSSDEVSGDIDTGIIVNETESCYIDVQGNVQIIVCPFLIAGTYSLTIDDVPETARAAVVILDNDGERVIPLTEEIQDGERRFFIGSGP